MPVWATILLAAVAFVWAAGLTAGWYSHRRDRARQADQFNAWMRQPRNRNYFDA